MNIDVEMMLYKDMLWLTEQTKRPINEFANVASQISLPDNYWDKFWKIVSIQRNDFTLSKKIV